MTFVITEYYCTVIDKSFARKDLRTLCATSTSWVIWGQFHQHFTSSFYVRRSQKHQKNSQVQQLFALLGSACIKAGRKHIEEIDPWAHWSNIILKNILSFYKKVS